MIRERMNELLKKVLGKGPTVVVSSEKLPFIWELKETNSSPLQFVLKKGNNDASYKRIVALYLRNEKRKRELKVLIERLKLGTFRESLILPAYCEGSFDFNENILSEDIGSTEWGDISVVSEYISAVQTKLKKEYDGLVRKGLKLLGNIVTGPLISSSVHNRLTYVRLVSNNSLSADEDDSNRLESSVNRKVLFTESLIYNHDKQRKEATVH